MGIPWQELGPTQDRTKYQRGKTAKMPKRLPINAKKNLFFNLEFNLGSPFSTHCCPLLPIFAFPKAKKKSVTVQQPEYEILTMKTRRLGGGVQG